MFLHNFSIPKDWNFTKKSYRNVRQSFNLHEHWCWCLADGSVIKIKAFLGVCFINFHNDFYLNLIGKPTLCLRPESTPSYNRQGRDFATLIISQCHSSYRPRINISMKKRRHLLSILSLRYRINWVMYWDLTSRGNRLYFGPGLVGTLGTFFLSFPHLHYPSFIHQRWPSPKTEKDVEPCIFHGKYARNEYALLFTLRWVYQLTFLVPTFYDISYKVPSLFASLLLSLTLFVQSSEMSLLVEPKTGLKKFVAVLFCYLLLDLIVFFRLKFCPGWLAQH